MIAAARARRFATRPFLVFASLALMAAGAPPQSDALPKLGVNYVYHGMGKFVRAHGGTPEEYIAHQNEKLRRIGPVWVRSAGKGDRTALHWATVEPTDGAFDFTLHDARVRDSQGRGLLMLGNVDFSDPPSYARVGGKYFDDAKYLAFLRKIVERYDGDGQDDMPGLTQPIKFWEIGNEPGGRGEFHGTAEDYAHVLGISRESIQANDPDAKVLIGGWVIGQLREEETWRRALELFDRTLAAGGGAWFDIMNYHEYTDDCDFLTYCHVNGFQELLKKYGLVKPFWITEANTKLQKEGKGRYAGVSVRHTVERQAQDLVKRAIVAFDAGVDVFFWHRIDDIKGESLGVGLFDENDQPKPVFYNLQFLASRLEGFRSIQRIRQMPDSIYLYRLETNAGAEFVLWTEAEDMTLDLSSCMGAEEVEMTYAITEGGESQPMIRTAPRSSVPVTQTPVFIRPIG
ncbi:MAG: hypothetical protein NTW86_12095 [Candidatus Sumerlaeota bacterium]|nr:hypothetical protein [Candidatus Sumerlaeota bacterium]